MRACKNNVIQELRDKNLPLLDIDSLMIVAQEIEQQKCWLTYNLQVAAAKYEKMNRSARQELKLVR